MMIVDPPVSPYSPEDEILAWLEVLASLPQDDPSVIGATEEARGWLAREWTGHARTPAP
jgi:hypothetical protein